MHQIFVELYNYNDGWRQETPEKRMAFVLEISKAINSLADHGIEVIAYCFNDQETDRRAPFDFFCVYRVPSIEAQRIFEQQIAASDWYRYFDQVNLRGAAMSPTGVLLANVALAPAIPQSEPISSAMPYAKHYAKAFDRQMAYIEAGHGDPIVFLHGDVMSSYLWRNVIPHVESLGRCIAIDLIGAGDSDKLPGSGPGSYNFAEHSRYLDALLEELRIDGNVVFVGHDWGANLAIDWAARHETKVKGIAFSEPLVPPFEWSDWPQYVTPLFELLRSDAAERAVLDHNMFVRASAAGGNLRMLAPEERAEIERPYAEAGEARRPTLTWRGKFRLSKTTRRHALASKRMPHGSQRPKCQNFICEGYQVRCCSVARKQLSVSFQTCRKYRSKACTGRRKTIRMQSAGLFTIGLEKSGRSAIGFARADYAPKARWL